jgi:hypothetical protein
VASSGKIENPHRLSNEFVVTAHTIPPDDELLAVKIVVTHLADATDEQVCYACERLRSRRLPLQAVGLENARRLTDQESGIP